MYPDQRATFFLASKLAGELYVRHADRRGALRSVILRIASVYGAGMTRENAVLRFARDLSAGRSITLTDAGSYQSDLVHVLDVADAIVGCLEHRIGGILNIGSGVRTSMVDLAHTLVDVLGADPSLVRVDGAPREHFGSPGLDISRARRELAFDPRPLRAGLMEFAATSAPAAAPHAR